MAIMDDWLNSLNSPYYVSIISDQDLVYNVELKQIKRKKDLTQKGKSIPSMKKVSAISGLPMQLTIKPIQLLHKIGKMTTPTFTNLVDISSTWAILRYLWAFQADTNKQYSLPPSLRLSKEARDIDFHQKALLSDEMGVGFAAYIMERCFMLSEHVDVDAAVKINLFGQNIQRKGRRSPDYFFFDPNQNNLHLVECKGTTTQKNNSYEQIRSGTEQLPSIIGINVIPMVVATCLMKEKTEIFIVDPPNENENSECDIKNNWKVNDKEEFFKNLFLLSRIKKMVFAGSLPGAIELINRLLPRYRYDILLPVSEKHHTEIGCFQGFRQEFLDEKLNITVFRGTLTDLLVTDDDLFKKNLSLWKKTFYDLYSQSDQENKPDNVLHNRIFDITLDPENKLNVKKSKSNEVIIQNIDYSGTLLEFVLQRK